MDVIFHSGPSLATKTFVIRYMDTKLQASRLVLSYQEEENQCLIVDVLTSSAQVIFTLCTETLKQWLVKCVLYPSSVIMFYDLCI